MFPQGLIDMIENAKWYLINSMGCVEGPFDSDRDASEVRNKMVYPKEWAFRRVMGE